MVGVLRQAFKDLENRIGTFHTHDGIHSGIGFSELPSGKCCHVMEELKNDHNLARC